MTTLFQSTRRVLSSTLAALSLLTACASTGTAVGKLEQPTGKPDTVTLFWKSDAAEPERGSISGTLPDGSHYSGRYYEVVKTARADVYAPAWEGWRPYWAGWRPRWYAGPIYDMDWPAFVDVYTGRVIANLKSDDAASRLRCRFQIDDPLAGLVHGGKGECQLSSGATIDHVIVTPS